MEKYMLLLQRAFRKAFLFRRGLVKTNYKGDEADSYARRNVYPSLLAYIGGD